MLREFVTKNRREIIRRCKTKKLKRARFTTSATAAVDHGVPIFLDELVDELRLRTLPNPEIAKTATKHGHDLMRQGFTIGQVVHGYGDVCQAVTEIAVEMNRSISSDDFRLLNRALDDAIAAAVTQYAEERDTAIQGETADETDRMAVLAHKARNSIQTARSALEAIRSGRVGVAGSTGTVLDESLGDADSLIEQLLAARVFVNHRSVPAKAKAKVKARLA
jgi:hypothetical protein